MSSQQNKILNLSVENYQLQLINKDLMALTTSRVRYLVVRGTKDVFWMRYKISFSNLTPKRSFHDRVNYDESELYDRMKGFHTLNDAKYAITAKEREILKLLVDELKLNENLVLNEIMKHPKRKFLNIQQVGKTLKFLKCLGFTKQMIADVPAICFYPSGYIKTSLEEVRKNSVELYKIGYENGSVENDTPGFLLGSKSKDKRLQLCLYYMELPFCFNGSGIFDIDDSDLRSHEKEQ